MNLRGLLSIAGVLSGLLLFGVGCETPETKSLREEIQRQKTIVLNYDKEIQDLMKQIEAAEAQHKKLEIALAGKDKKIDALKNAIQDLKGAVKLTQKVQHQLEILAARLGGTLVDNRLQLPADFFFGSGQYDLRPEAQATLKELANILKDEKLVLLIVGHTDNDKIKNKNLIKKDIKTNRHLSLMRSLSVLNELKKDGYDTRLMYPTGWGELMPVGDNNTSKGKALNRRVEIFIDPAASNFFGISAITGIEGVSGEGGAVIKEE